jgi:hypothetical protein
MPGFLSVLALIEQAAMKIPIDPLQGRQHPPRLKRLALRRRLAFCRLQCWNE